MPTLTCLAMRGHGVTDEAMVAVLAFGLSLAVGLLVYFLIQGARYRRR